MNKIMDRSLHIWGWATKNVHKKNDKDNVKMTNKEGRVQYCTVGIFYWVTCKMDIIMRNPLT